MIPYLGSFPVGYATVCIPWHSFAAATGASAAASAFANTDVLIYKDGNVAQRASASGIAVATSFDGQVGLQMITIDLSDNTDAGFYVGGHDYQVAVADVTIDGQTVRFWAAQFSIERMSILDMPNAIETGLTVRQLLRLLGASNAGKLSGAGTATEIFRNAVADTKARITATVDAPGNRTNITTDVS